MRTRTMDTSLPYGGEIHSVTDTHWVNACFPDSKIASVRYLSGSVLNSVSTITDEIGYSGDNFVYLGNGKWRKRKPNKLPHRFIGRQSSLKPWLAEERFSKPTRRCTHDKSTYTPIKGAIDTVHVDDISPGNFCFHRLNSLTTSYPNYESLMSELLSCDAHTGFSASLSRNYSVDAYHSHDWFALMDSFQEASDSFLQSGFLVGEDIAEDDIFVDAIKLVINPSSFIRTFLKHTIKHVKDFRGKNLGQIAKRLSRHGSQSFLSYEFAIRPAIGDVMKTLDAHSKVASRMDYLRLNAGDFVPIRVRKVLPSDISNFTPPSPVASWSKYISCKRKDTTACASCYGRVRKDLNFSDTWSAYLQYFGINKIIGLAWELIPFTFVLDWFTNAQERINYYTRLHTGNPFTEYRGFCVSEKQYLTEELNAVPSNTLIAPVDPFVVATHDVTKYQRYLDFPDTSGVVDLSTLGSFHALAAGSLIIQRALR